MTCHNYVRILFQSYRKAESPSSVQKLKSDKNLVNGIIKNLPEHCADQVTEAVNLIMKFNAKRLQNFCVLCSFTEFVRSFFLFFLTKQ